MTIFYLSQACHAVVQSAANLFLKSYFLKLTGAKKKHISSDFTDSRKKLTKKNISAFLLFSLEFSGVEGSVWIYLTLKEG